MNPVPHTNKQDSGREADDRMMRLVETSAHTTMGKLLRKFWHPVALSKTVAAGTARPVRLLGEDLALYRGQSGTAYLIADRCAHRRTRLHTGWVEGEQLRCMYHGWKYDATGQCVERPAERPGTEAGIRIAGYPVHEYCGLVFAWLGEGEPPAFELPRKDVFERKNVMVFQRQEIWPCNWLQHAENSLDGLHVSFAHRMGSVGAFGDAVTATIPDLAYEESLAGVMATTTRTENGKSQIRIADWTFPHTNHVTIPTIREDTPWAEISNFMVPVDDTHTNRVSLIAVESTSPEVDAEMRRYFEGCEAYNAADHHDELFAGKYPEDPLIELTSAQDYVVLVGQGAIADRAHERLGTSDRGIATLRRIFWREMEAINAGKPTKSWRRNEEKVVLCRTVDAAGSSQS
jgi:phenylpropionate dioxygenase-like ring-hydroxylating dioxygenase large terminal subunit